MDRRRFLSIAGGALVCGLAGCSSRQDDAGGQSEPDGDPDNAEFDVAVNVSDVDGTLAGKPDGLKLISHAMYRDDRNVVVTGEVENTSDTDFENVTARVVLTDGTTTVAEATHSSDDELGQLESGELWRFAVKFPRSEVEGATDYRIHLDGDHA